jgi:hypothetical protein
MNTVGSATANVTLNPYLDLFASPDIPSWLNERAIEGKIAEAIPEASNATNRVEIL